jgi:hypothetical protein
VRSIVQHAAGTKHAGIEFSSDGTLRYLDAAGTAVAGTSGGWKIFSNDPPYIVQIWGMSHSPDDDLDFWPSFSRGPLKILARDNFGSVLSAW